MQHISHIRQYATCCLVCTSLFISSTAFPAMNSFPPAAELPRSSDFPDPLLMSDGSPVVSKQQWFSKRRPELKELFEHYMYGYQPEHVKMRSVVDRVDPGFMGGKATLKLVTLDFPKTKVHPIHVMVVVPNQHKPAPVFVALNFCGNHAMVTDAQVPLPTSWISGKAPQVVDGHATEAGRGSEAATWAVEKTIERGYAIASVYYGDIEPDKGDATDGVRELLEIKEKGDSRWGAVAAWAWGIQRIVDYVVTDKDLDHKRIAAVGHSRLGKATLLAAALDERIAIAFPHQAGCGGTAPSRSTLGESVERINQVFPYWFCDEFKKFSTQPERLPFDQHCLIAMCAPRPVLLTCAVEDTWSNPPGQFQMLKAADKVYRLTGSEGLAAQQMPQPGNLICSPLGYFIRPGVHSMTDDDWKVFLDFADRRFSH